MAHPGSRQYLARTNDSLSCPLTSQHSSCKICVSSSFKIPYSCVSIYLNNLSVSSVGSSAVRRLPAENPRVLLLTLFLMPTTFCESHCLQCYNYVVDAHSYISSHSVPLVNRLTSPALFLTSPLNRLLN